MTQNLREELDNQIEDKIGFRSGVAVKLFKPKKMSNLTFADERICHPTVGHRIWMNAEYEILSEIQIKELKKLWS